jgi:hypothetical protein
MVTFHVRQRRALVGFHLRQCGHSDAEYQNCGDPIPGRGMFSEGFGSAEPQGWQRSTRPPGSPERR